VHSVPDPRSKDWLGSSRTSLLAWWLPTAPSCWSVYADHSADGYLDRGPCLDGHACLLNARQCGRTHCRYTGPYYLAMIVPVAVVGLGIAPLGPYGWLGLAISFLVAATSFGGSRNMRGQVLHASARPCDADLVLWRLSASGGGFPLWATIAKQSDQTSYARLLVSGGNVRLGT